MSSPAQFQGWPDEIQPGFGPYRAVVERIVDGDTLYVFIDLGLNQYTYESIRLLDVFAPELFTSDPFEKQKGIEARNKLASLVPLGTKCLLQTERDKMTFGRYVGELILENGASVNSMMKQWLLERGN